MSLRKDFDVEIYHVADSPAKLKVFELLPLIGFENVRIHPEDYTYDIDADFEGVPKKIEVEERQSEKQFNVNWNSGYREGLNIPQKQQILKGEIDLFVTCHPSLDRFILVDKAALNASVSRGAELSPNKFKFNERFFQVPYSDVDRIEIVDGKAEYQPIKPF
jgi:hypothetical protein